MNRSVWGKPAGRMATIATGVITLVLVGMSSYGSVFAATASNVREQQFTAAAQEFGVPVQILLAVSYNESRWESHGGTPSIDGGYGPMDLRTYVATATDGKGTDKAPQKQPAEFYTLDQAVDLLHVSSDQLKTDIATNLRGGAAVLAAAARKTNNGRLPAAIGDWYGAIVSFSGATNAASSQQFADDVFATMQTGADLTTSDGQQLKLAGDAGLRPNKVTAPLGRLPLQMLPQAQTNQNNPWQPECPKTLNCRFVPAAYVQDDPNDPTNYGNYDIANRPKDMKIKYIVIHDMEGSYDGSISWFQNPASYVSGHYMIRSSDGAITQMVPTSGVAWGAGDWYVNMHAINIEHEGFAANGSTWYTETMYKSSATLVRYLAAKYDIPLDRQHIVGHDNVPTISPSRLAGQHWDPGPYWDWNHYMALLHGWSDQTEREHDDTHMSIQTGKVVTIAPDFATNQPPVTDCSTTPCTTLPVQGANLVYLHTEPNAASPLLSDPYLHSDNSPGTTRIEDWSATATTGEKYVVANTQGDWTGIWFAGHIGWFFNPSGAGQTAHRSLGQKVIPRTGLQSVPVYGDAFPESSAYPAVIPVQTLTPLYTIPAGQQYTTSGKVITDYYYAATVDLSAPDDHTVVKGSDSYLQVTFNHRQGYVKASDVDIQ